MRILLSLLMLLSAITAFAQESTDTSVRFKTVHIYVDSHDVPLAAYQLEFTATSGNVKIVGIEGGESPAFKEPPHYDPKAMQKERVILAAFSTDATNDLPKGKIRVATIHVQITGSQTPDYSVKLSVAADSTGKKISALATFDDKPQP